MSSRWRSAGSKHWCPWCLQRLSWLRRLRKLSWVKRRRRFLRHVRGSAAAAGIDRLSPRIFWLLFHHHVRASSFGFYDRCASPSSPCHDYRGIWEHGLWLNFRLGRSVERRLRFRGHVQLH
jgi:hypothetical protein